LSEDTLGLDVVTLHADWIPMCQIAAVPIVVVFVVMLIFVCSGVLLLRKHRRSKKEVSVHMPKQIASVEH